MPSFEFIHYATEDASPAAGDILKRLPSSVAGQRQRLIKKSGLDPSEIKLVGLLLTEWGKHRANSIIIATDEVLTKETKFAVSTFTISDSWPANW